MSSKVELLDNGMAVLTVEVDVDTFKQAMKEAYKRNAKHFNYPGFRKGKAPMQLVLNTYGESVLYDAAFDICAQPAYEEALKEQNQEPYSTPQVDIVEIGMDKGVKFTAEYALKPEVELGEYKGVTAYCPPTEVTDEQVDQRIEREREKVSRIVTVTDRNVEKDDMVNINYSGSIDGEKFDGGTGDNYDLKIGSGTFIPGFEDQLIGHATGDEVEVKVTFPEDYHAKELAGKEAIFATKINEIKVRELPDLDDEFVKDVSEDCDTLEQYKESIRQELAESQNKYAEMQFKENALKVAVDNAKMNIPEVVVVDEMRRMLREQEQQMRQQGFTLDQYLSIMGMKKEDYMLTLREPANYRLRSLLVIDKIAEVEKMEATDEDYEKYFTNMSEMYKQPLDKIKEQFDNERMREYLKEDIMRTKVSDFVMENAVKTDVEPKTEHVHDENCGCADKEEHCACEAEHGDHPEECECECHKEEKKVAKPKKKATKKTAKTEDKATKKTTKKTTKKAKEEAPEA